MIAFDLKMNKYKTEIKRVLESEPALGLKANFYVVAAATGRIKGSNGRFKTLFELNDRQGFFVVYR
ncbi:hypothetical protein GCM10028825_35240 [Spirosoma agri]